MAGTNVSVNASRAALDMILIEDGASGIGHPPHST